MSRTLGQHQAALPSPSSELFSCFPPAYSMVRIISALAVGGGSNQTLYLSHAEFNGTGASYKDPGYRGDGTVRASQAPPSLP